MTPPVLHVRPLKGFKYQLAQSARFAVPEFPRELEFHHKYFRLMKGTLSVKEGYAWDGPSGPTLDTPASIAASLCHDVFYQAIRLRLISPAHRCRADRVFLRHCLDYGLPWWRSLYYFAALRLCGGEHARPLPEGEAGEPPDLIISPDNPPVV
ncbi:hypothetical protein [Geminisphaera colitermitum]|uniref:hypothetical protein n=1 Tax=Geminisphaera colitermitum TaxID=1148786 RepID=UPI000158CDC4|nr:hypothetical protein [Geminisphaera colitermitum]